MQLNFRLLSVITLATFTTFTACKKDSSSTSTDPSVELTAHADDQSEVSSQIDAVVNNVDAAVETSAVYTGKMQNPPVSICDATVTYDSVSNPRTITITYNGNTCNGAYTRNGVVTISMAQGVQWKNQGATVTVAYQNLKIVRVADNKSITINGSHTITNVSGGLLSNLASLPSVTHVINSDNMSITFSDNTQRTWHVARRRVFTLSNNQLVITITGNYSDGTHDGIAEWGINRFGHAFTTTITQPLVIRQDCNFRLTSGEVKHEGFATATVTFGLDATGNPTSCPGTGHYYFKVFWTGPNGASANAILPY